MTQITSHKLDSKNGRHRKEFSGNVTAKFGLVHSGGSVGVNMRDKDRSWFISFTAEEAKRLAEFMRERGI